MSETRLGRYLRETGTRQSWLAERMGISLSKVSRWCNEGRAISPADARRVLEILRERRALSLDGLVDDLPPWPYTHADAPRPRPGVPLSPFEAALERRERERENERTGIAERPLDEVIADIAGEG